MRYARITIACLVVFLAGALVACGGRPTQEPPPTNTPEVIVVTSTPEPTVPPAPATAEPTVATVPEAGPTAEPVAGPGGAKGGLPRPETAEPTAEVTQPQGAAAAGAVTSLADVKGAVIQIEAQGTFIDPEFGLQLNAAGRGSGFIVDEAGVAVTNNHVATGAAFLRVWVAGETRPRNAKILGVSECSDLAVIDIDGDGFSFLEWYDGDATPGLGVFVAGFPLGDQEYTLTRGIISKERAEGDLDWASVDNVIEHDARLNPGNSGGPLVTEDGQVVGVNFAARQDTGQSYAIGRREFERVFGDLSEGRDVTSIGVNGVVVQSRDGSISGVWVASVESGSPADKAGIRGGDILMQLEGLVLGTDGTMADYCDILRSREATDTMSVTVLRYATGEVLEGQLNGRELQVVQVMETLPSGGSSDATAQEYMTVWDNSRALTMEVPTDWSDVRGDPWVDEDGAYIGAMIVAAPDSDAFLDSLDVPGVFFVASRGLAAEYTVDALLTDLSFTGSCSQQGPRQSYDDGLYVGKYEEHGGCGADGGTTTYVIAAMPEEQDYMLWLGIQVRGEGGLDVATQIADTFLVAGDLE